MDVCILIPGLLLALIPVIAIVASPTGSGCHFHGDDVGTFVVGTYCEPVLTEAKGLGDGNEGCNSTVSAFQFEADNGELCPQGSVSVARDCASVATAPGRVWCAGLKAPGFVSSIAVKQSGGAFDDLTLSLQGAVPIPSPAKIHSPLYMRVGDAGEWAFIAAAEAQAGPGGFVGVAPISQDGTVGDVAPDTNVQVGGAVAVAPAPGAWSAARPVVVASSDTLKVLLFTASAPASLAALNELPVAACGPRRLLFAPGAGDKCTAGCPLYVLCGQSASVLHLTFTCPAGRFMDCVLSNPGASTEGTPTLADTAGWEGVDIAAAGTRVWALVRRSAVGAAWDGGADGRVAVFTADGSGALTAAGDVTSGGPHPSALAVGLPGDEPARWLVVVNGGGAEGGDPGTQNVRLVAIDAGSGLPAGEAAAAVPMGWSSGGSPASVAFIPAAA